MTTAVVGARRPHLVVDGDPRHGVVRFARELAGAVAAPVDAPAPGDDAPLHLHFTERVWGADPERAVERVLELTGRRAFTVTLHDLPQATDGPTAGRRAAAYRRVVAAARAVVVSSRHEAALLAAFSPARPVVIPLPVMLQPSVAGRPVSDGSVALLGYVYPGKGHHETIEAVAALAAGHPRPTGWRVVALGSPARGHERDLRTLQVHADALGVAFHSTGYLDEPALLEACRRVAVPVTAHRAVSASGSIGSWIAAGRRPLVPATRYGRELAALRPGTVSLYAPGDLAGAIARARAAPDSTWWGPDAVLGPDLAAVAEAYVAFWAGVAW